MARPGIINRTNPVEMSIQAVVPESMVGASAAQATPPAENKTSTTIVQRHLEYFIAVLSLSLFKKDCKTTAKSAKIKNLN
jgi:hypothetical protein